MARLGTVRVNRDRKLRGKPQTDCTNEKIYAMILNLGAACTLSALLTILGDIAIRIWQELNGKRVVIHT